MHAAWLARQYGVFQERVLALLAGPSATLQVGNVMTSALCCGIRQELR